MLTNQLTVRVNNTKALSRQKHRSIVRLVHPRQSFYLNGLPATLLDQSVSSAPSTCLFAVQSPIQLPSKWSFSVCARG